MRGMKRAYLLFAATIVAVDQLIKCFVRQMPEKSIFFELSGIVRITHRSNTGAAFSLFAGKTALIAIFSLVLIAALWWILRGMRLSGAAKIAFAALAAGGLGNLIDRAFFGRVTDYIQTLFVDFPVFNFADMCITCAFGALLFLLMTNRLEEKG